MAFLILPQIDNWEFQSLYNNFTQFIETFKAQQACT